MNFKKFHESKNLCPIANFYKTTDLYYSILFETPLPAGTYTISAEITSTSTESRISFRKNDMSQMIASNITIQTGRSQLTVTISEPCYALYIYGSTTVYDNIPIKFENIMLNTGSTPQPYEPYSSEVWHDIPYYIHKTATDTLTLPATLYPNDTSITVGLKGQSSQSGTPSPQNPVDVNGTGERTENLYLKKIANATINADGSITSNNAFDCYLAKVEANKQYIGTGFVYSFFVNEPFIGSGGSYDGQRVVAQVSDGFTSPIDGYVAVRHNTGITDAMLNSGSTAKPYEPYGYKIPISMGGTTNNVYLGEVQTVRQIKKYEFTGQESWVLTSAGYFYSSNAISDYNNGSILYREISSMFSHYIATTNNTNGNLLTNGCACLYCYNSSPTLVHEVYIRDERYLTADDFKTYLQQQYSAGTPVTVWYVLATATTGTVNEPLQKIGSYSDSLTTSIPCTAGENTLDVQTTVQPSEVTANYQGWHPVQSVHEKSKNLFDKSTAISGERILASSVVADATVAHSNYIDVTGVSNLAVSHKYTATNFYFYSDKTNASIGYVNGYTADVPTGAKYCRINIQIEDLNNTMLNTGSSALPYEPFWD
jgi:hypothetical protein